MAHRTGWIYAVWPHIWPAFSTLCLQLGNTRFWESHPQIYPRLGSPSCYGGQGIRTTHSNTLCWPPPLGLIWLISSAATNHQRQLLIDHRQLVSATQKRNLLRPC